MIMIVHKLNHVGIFIIHRYLFQNQHLMEITVGIFGIFISILYRKNIYKQKLCKDLNDMLLLICFIYCIVNQMEQIRLMDYLHLMMVNHYVLIHILWNYYLI